MNTLLQKTFQNKYSLSSFEEFTAKLFQKSSGDFIHQKIFPNDFDEKHKNSQLLLSFETEDKKKIEVLSIELKTKSNVENARSYQRGLIERYINQNIDNGKTVDGAFVAFWNTEESSWRLSFISLEVKDGKQIFSPPKRFSFLVGEAEPTHTAEQQFSKELTAEKTPTFNQLLKVFSVEKVTKDFYAEIQKSFFELVGAKVKKGKQAIIATGVLTLPHKNPEKNHKDFQDFAVRLFGRIIFSWFLQKKKFADGTPLISKKILSLQAVQHSMENNEHFYHAILEPLFFETLNKEKLARNTNLFPKNLLDDFEKIPFLNGGLFQDQKGDTGDFYTTDAFAKLSAQHSPQIPNEWFEELFIVLERYNFTIDENSKLETEVSIDPEILGRIFENLLAEINPETGESARKSSGSFYTPREIVDYMVEESLLEFLEGKFPKSQQKNISKEEFLELSIQNENTIKNFFNDFPTKNLNIDLSYFTKEKFSQCIFSPRLFLKFQGNLKTKKGHNTAHKEIDENVWKNILNEKITVIHKFFGKPKEVFLEGKNYFYPSVQIIFSFFDTLEKKDRFFTAFFTPLFSNKMQLNTLFEINEKRIKSYTKKYSSILEKMSKDFEISNKNKNKEKAQGRTLTPPYEFTSEDETLGSSAYWSDQFSAVLQELFQSKSILQKENLHVKFGGLTGLLQRVENIISGTEEVNEEKAKLKVLEALDTLKILDPACGSGAFPMGILQKVVHILEKIDPDNKIYLEQVVNQNPPEIRETVRKYLKSKDLNYVRKLGVIQKSIFGVDIQEMAIEISRLRFFLSLVVDENPEDIEPLPNLDFKFVAANSLIPLPENKELQTNMFDDEKKINDLEKVREEYFSAHSDVKNELKEKFKKIQNELWNGSCLFSAEHKKKSFELVKWEPFKNESASFFDPKWMFGVKDGFDIVIGNPPYVGEKGNKKTFDILKSGNLAKNFYLGKMDLFYFFFHLGIDLAKEKGIISFITTNYYPTAGGARKLRADIKERTNILHLLNFNELKIFESAAGQHNLITVLQKGKEDKETKTCITKRKGDASKETLEKIISWKDEETEYSIVPQKNIFDGEENYIRFSSGINPMDKILDKIKKQGVVLGGKQGICNVNTGLFTAADKVYIRNEEEITKEFTSLNKIELSLLRPLFKNSDINKYSCSLSSNKKVIYHYEKAPYNIEDIPSIFSYLSSFENKLKNRRDNSLKGALKRGRWDVMALPKIAINFEAPKIVAPQRSKTNTFGYNEIPWYAASDVFFITPKENSDIELKYILALLNSKLYFQWLYHRGKRKGENLELIAKPLSEIPIKKISPEAQKPFIQKVEQILAITSGENYDSKNIPEEQEKLERGIDILVFKLYGLTEEEIKVVDNEMVLSNEERKFLGF